MNVISDDEIKEIHKIRRHRNEIAHELPRLIINSNLDVNLDYLFKIRELISKIDTWWIMEVEMTISYKETPKLDGVKTGRMMSLDHIFTIRPK